MKLFIALAATAGMVAAMAGLFAFTPTDASPHDGLVLSYSEGSNTAADEVQATLTESNLQVKPAPQNDPPAARDVEATEEPEATVEPLATEEPEETETATPEETETETATATPTATEEPKQAAAPPPASGNALLDAVNAKRSAAGKNPLIADGSLMAAASSYCQALGQYFDSHSQLSHSVGGSIGQRVKAHGFNGSAWGEAIAWTANAASSGLFGEVAQMWWNSAGHHDLLYSPSTGYGGVPYTHAGAASCTSPGGTGIYVVEVGAY